MSLALSWAPSGPLGGRVNAALSEARSIPDFDLRYYFGDGTAPEDHPASAGGANHTFVAAGDYLVGVAAAANPPGYTVDSDSITVTAA